MHLSVDKFPEQIMLRPHPFQTVPFRRDPHRGQAVGVKYFTRASASEPEISQSALIFPVTLRVLHELVEDELRIQRGLCLKKAKFDVILLAGQTIREGSDDINLVLLSSAETIALFFKGLMRDESQETNSTTSDAKKYSSGRRVSFLTVTEYFSEAVILLASESLKEEMLDQLNFDDGDFVAFKKIVKFKRLSNVTL